MENTNAPTGAVTEKSQAQSNYHWIRAFDANTNQGYTFNPCNDGTGDFVESLTGERFIIMIAKVPKVEPQG
jgi:hypothetical protein